MTHFRFFLILLLLSVAFRIIPHAPNFNPEIVFALAIGQLFNQRFALLAVLALAIFSDLAGSVVSGYSAFGSWTLFTYSAVIMIALLGSQYATQLKSTKFIVAALGSSLGFWIWTNVSTYLFSGLYAHTLVGLAECYVLALPFLGTSLCAALLWSVALMLPGVAWMQRSEIQEHRVTQKFR